MYKMIVMDMDGTLLTDDKKISDRNKRVLKEAAEMGVKIAISTGRMFASARIFGRMIGVDAPIIASNGAYIREKDSDEVIYAQILGEENIREIIKIGHKYGLNCGAYTWNSLFTEKLVHTSLNYKKWNENLPDDEKVKITIVDKSGWDDVIEEYKDSILKMVMTHEDIELVKAFRKDLSSLNVELTSSDPVNVEVTSKGVSKGKAVEVLAKHYNIDREEVMCIGDSENDLSMIEYAGLGVAMENGNDEVKKAAKFITLSNQEDGVAYAIEKFILNR